MKTHKPNFKAMLKRAKALVWVYLTSVFALKLFGISLIDQIDNTLSIEFIDKSFMTRNTVQVILCSISYCLMYIYALETHKFKHHYKKLLAVIFVYSVFINIMIELNMTSLFTMILSFAMYFVPFFICKCNMRSILFIVAVDIVFQAISVLTRASIIPTERETVIISFVLSFDYYLMWCVLALNKLIGGEEQCHSGESVLSYLVKSCKSYKQNAKSYCLHCKKRLATLRKNICQDGLNNALKTLRCWVKFILPIKLKK